MIELAETYLGNITENISLRERIENDCSQKHSLEVYLSPTDTPKGRIYTHSSCGKEIGIIKSRDWELRQGDVFQTQQGKLLLIHLQQQKIMVLTFSEGVNDRLLDLVYLGYVLGNHHWPILVQDDKIYVQLAADEKIIEETIHNFQIPGLEITYEWRSPTEQLRFSQDKHHHH